MVNQMVTLCSAVGGLQVCEVGAGEPGGLRCVGGLRWGGGLVS